MARLVKYIFLFSSLPLLASAAWSATGSTVNNRAGDKSPSGSGSISRAAKSIFSPNTDLVFSVSKTSQPPRIDGRLDESFWKSAVKLGNFSEISPGDNVKPEVDTETLFAYDDDNLYIGFICYDHSTDEIRASITDRDEIFQDDMIGIMIDTFKDQQNAYEFFVNPYGIQGDLRRTYNREDGSFDTVWESCGEINSVGWTAELAIPFRSLRFPDAYEQEWGIHIIRVRPRDSREQHSWAPISRDESCLFCQAGTLRGIMGVNRGKNLEILPYAITSQRGDLIDHDDSNSGFHDQDAKGEAGFGLKYGLTPNLTLDFTYNPDFSQVESDAAQIDVNTTFALYFPEKRPFFLEGSDIFRTKADIVYTRSILDPVAAAKITGKIGKYTIGYMLIHDNTSPFVVPFEDQSEEAIGGKSVSNILRLKRDFLSDSYVGLLFTDRRLSDGSNSVIGFDGNIRFLEDYRISSLVLYTHTQEPNDLELSAEFSDTTFGGENHTAVFDGEKFDGFGMRASISRDARHWNFSINYDDVSPTFRAENGFITNNNFRLGGIWTGLLFQPNNRVLEVIEPSFNWGRKYIYGGTFKDTWTVPQIFIRFKKQTSLWTSYLWSEELFKGVLIPGIRRSEGNINTNFSEIISGGFYWRVGHSVVRWLDPPELGRERTFEVWATLKPTAQLKLSASYQFARMLEIDSGDRIYNGYIARSRFTYQFTRRLYFRLVSQYNDFSKRIAIDPLLSYKINPFTVFFIGSTHSLKDYESNSGYTQTDRRFFVKFQYLFRI